MARKRTPKPTIAPPVASEPTAPVAPLPDLAAFATEPSTPAAASKAALDYASGTLGTPAVAPPYEISDAARDKAIAVIGEVIEGDSVSIESKISAAETILKLEGMTPELEDVLVRLVDPPGDYKQRLRAARLLLGVS